MTQAALPIVTNVGWAVEGDNLFRGLSVRDDLASKANYWATVVLAAGGPLLSPEEASFVDDLAICFNAADPRIWPLKLAWLASCYGSMFAGASASIAMFDHIVVGPAPVADVAEMLIAVRALAAEASCVRTCLTTWFQEERRACRRVPGFGVMARDQDERSELIKATAVRHCRQQQPFFKLLILLEEVGREVLQQPINAGMTFAGCLLDLGLSPEHARFVANFALCVPLFANARDAAQAQAPALRSMSTEDLRYIGRPERQSPRKAATEWGACP